jgi:hypothetical protein
MTLGMCICATCYCGGAVTAVLYMYYTMNNCNNCNNTPLITEKDEFAKISLVL